MAIHTQAGTGLRLISLSATDDLVAGAQRWELWGRMGWLDIKRRYRRTMIGPFWSSLTLLIFIVVLGSVGSGLLSKETSDYMPFLVSGMVVWTMFSSIMTESCAVFTSGAGLIRQMNFEYSVLPFALIWRNFIVFLHNLVVWLLVMLTYKPQALGAHQLLVVPALMLLMLNGLWISLVLGTIAARFRDVQQLVQSVVQVAMFVTPLFWPPESMTGIRRIVFVGLNPFYHLLSIVRDPLNGQLPNLNSYIAVTIITVVGWGIAYVIFDQFRKRIAYWL